MKNNHTDLNKRKTKAYLYLKEFFGFCKTFRKVPKMLGFHLMLKTADLQDIIYTSMGHDVNLTINNLYHYIPNLIPCVETQLTSNEATQKNYKTSFDELYTEKRLLSDLLTHHDIGSAQQVKSPNYLISAHQACLRTTTPDKQK